MLKSLNMTIDKSAEPALLRNYFFIGIVAYFLVLLATIPAGLVWPVISERFAPLKLETEGATIWRGTKKPARINNAIEFELDWKWNPLALLSARFEYFFDINHKAGMVKTNVKKRLFGDTVLLNTSGHLSLDKLLTSTVFFQAMPFKTRGQLLIESLTTKPLQNWPRETKGKIRINNLEISKMKLGTWSGNIISSENQKIVVSFENIDSFIQGKVELAFHENGSLNISWNLKESESTPSNIINNMAVLGDTNAAGYRRGSYRAAWK